jgi:hypothetical protein
MTKGKKEIVRDKWSMIYANPSVGSQEIWKIETKIKQHCAIKTITEATDSKENDINDLLIYD